MTAGLWGTALAADPFEEIAAGARAGAGVGEVRADGAGGAVRDAVRDAAQAALIDLLASGLAGRREPAVARLRGALVDVAALAGGRRAVGGEGEDAPAGESPGVAVLGQPGRYLPADAALLGGFQAHVLDLDDAHAVVRGHPSAVLVPTLLALADDATRGADLLAAYVVGVEVMARLGALAGRSHHAAGWHPTATLGGIAAAVAGARLLGLGEDATASAAALAASMAGGTRAQFGSDAKPLHAGLAAAAGVRAVTWAQAGLTGTVGATDGALFGPESLARAMSFEVTDPADAAAALGQGWGDRWALVDPGLWFKRYPFCSAGMAVHEAAVRVGELIRAAGRHTTDAGTVRAVRACLRPGADAALRYGVPATGAQGRFSLEYLVALGILDREPVNSRFVDLDADSAALAQRVVRVYGPPEGTPRARVEVTLADGASYTADVTEPAGSPGRPPSPEQRHAKLAEAVGTDAARHIETAVAALPGGTVGNLRRALRAVTEEETP